MHTVWAREQNIHLYFFHSASSLTHTIENGTKLKPTNKTNENEQKSKNKLNSQSHFRYCWNWMAGYVMCTVCTIYFSECIMYVFNWVEWLFCVSGSTIVMYLFMAIECSAASFWGFLPLRVIVCVCMDMDVCAIFFFLSFLYLNCIHIPVDQ